MAGSDYNVPEIASAGDIIRHRHLSDHKNEQKRRSPEKKKDQQKKSDQSELTGSEEQASGTPRTQIKGDEHEIDCLA